MSPDFDERYLRALRQALEVADEAGLESAYELGREALSAGKGVIELASTHARALAVAAPEAPSAVARWASQFFAEALAPFEMALRGFGEANAALKASASTLETRVAERTRELSAAEKALREQTRILECVVESMSDGLAVCDRAGKFLLFNRAGKRLLGIGPVADVPTVWDQRRGTFQPDTTTPFVTEQLPLVRAMHGEQTQAVPMFVRSASLPEGIHLSVLGSPLLDEAGSVQGGIAVFRDITEARRAEDALLRSAENLRKTEEQLRQSQKMDAIGRLAGGVAHDFNNVLSVILSYSAMLLEDLRANDPLAADLREINTAGERAADLTRQLLMFSRQQVLEPVLVDVNALLSGMDKMLQRLIGADIALVIVPKDNLGKVRADRGSLEQVVMNLVVNARDAMPTGGQLTIESHNAVLDEDFTRQHVGVSPGPHVVLSVSDTGIGMDRATQARIFEPFFTTKEQGKGTGLGLSTVFGIVKQSGGSVWVYSEVGQGTTFKLYFPIVEGVIAGPQLARPTENLRGTETVLLVDDDDQVRAAARNILGRNGYRVLEAKNGLDALLVAEQQAGVIDLLITDVVMPQMSGPELTRRLAVSRPTMKLLCMSGYTDDTIVRHGVLEARIAYLQKPITPDALARKVRAVLDAPHAPASLTTA